MLTLVKDLQGTRVVYYWINKQRLERVSPILSSFPIAEEWRNRYIHEAYKGRDRRRSFIDRRKQGAKSSNVEKRKYLQSEGRRAGDKPASVEIDLAKVKLAELKLLYTEDLITESDIDQQVLFEAASDTPT